MTLRNLLIGFAWVAVVGLLFIVLFAKQARSLVKKWRLRPLPINMERVVSDGTFHDVIFLHHSTGQLLIKRGNLRSLLTQKGYQFWDHDYNYNGLTRPDGTRTGTCYDIPETTPGIRGGGNTDPDGLAVLFAQPLHVPADNAFSRLMQHRVILFKSCYPNSAIKSEAALEHLKTLYLGMRQVIDQHRDHVFVLLTSPPLHPLATDAAEGSRACALAKWLQSPEFLEGHPNLFVFDFFDQLADPTSHMLRTEYQLNPDASDSHPNARANQTIAPLLSDFVDRSIQSYAGKPH